MKSSPKKGGSPQEGDPAGFEYEKKFYVEKGVYLVYEY